MVISLLKFLLQFTFYTGITIFLILYFAKFFKPKPADKKPDDAGAPSKKRKSKKVLSESSGTVEPEVHVKRHNNYIPLGDTMLNVFIQQLGRGFTLKSNRIRNTHEMQNSYNKKNSV